jgi:hypothetical protein
MTLTLEIGLLLLCLGLLYSSGVREAAAKSKTLQEIRLELFRKPEPLAHVLLDCPFSGGVRATDESLWNNMKHWRTFHAIYTRLFVVIEGIEYVQTHSLDHPDATRRSVRLRRSARRLRLLVLVASIEHMARNHRESDVPCSAIQVVEQYSMLSAQVNLLLRDCFPDSLEV